MEDKKINFLPYKSVGQAVVEQEIREKKYYESLEKKLKKTIIAIFALALLLAAVVVYTLVVYVIPYIPEQGACEGLSRQEILQLENEREASRVIDAQVSRGGYDIREMEATAYTWTGFPTASGVYPQVGMVAVDTEIIPLGTQLYVEGYGPAIAADTGGDIVGDRIDLYMDTDAECWEFGRRDVRVKIIEEDL